MSVKYIYSINYIEFFDIIFYDKHLINYTVSYVLFTYCKNDKNHQKIQNFGLMAKQVKPLGLENYFH